MFTRRLAGGAAIAMVVTALALAGPAAQAAPRSQVATAASAAPAYTLPTGVTDPCPASAPGMASCATLTTTRDTSSATRQSSRADATAITPTGYSPTELRDAYDLGDQTGAEDTVAVVTPFNDADAASDLATYRSQYGLPACTTANGCFTKVSQTGSTTVLPTTSAAWSASTAESIEMISAICPSCKILLVEANSSSIIDLGPAVNEAVTLGAKFVDNDWFISEAQLGANEATYDSEYFNHPGVAITAPAGDMGYGVNYPAASPYVIAVGGTTLTPDSSVARGYDETAWGDSGSGCSAFEPKPSWQTDTGCAGRTLNDTAAVADPSTPVAYYDTPTEGGWGKGSGTAVAAAIVAATYALAGPPAPGTYPASYLYDHPSALNPVTSGSDGVCSVSYLCTAGSGYNGPSGMGTPDTYAAFHTTGAKPATVEGTNGTTWVFVTTTSGDIQADSLPSGSSTWSGLTSLGGGPWTGYPTALAASDGSIWVFALQRGNLYADTLPSGSSTWSGWSALGNGGSPMVGQATPVEDNSGNIYVFMRGSLSGNVHEDELPSGSSTWTGLSTNLGGDFPDNVAVEEGSGGFMHLVGVQNDSELYVNTMPPGGSWSGWTAVTGASVIGVPAIIQDKAGEVRLYVRRASDGDPLENDMAGGTTTWTGFSVLSSGSNWINDAAAWAGSGGTDWVFEIGSGTFINFDKLPSGSSTYLGWTGIASGFTGVPGIVQDTDGNDHLFARATDGDLEVDTLPGGTATWPAFTSLGGQLAGT
jgi:hypothetical protein